jgi:hypothetical protein
MYVNIEIKPASNQTHQRGFYRDQRSFSFPMSRSEAAGVMDQVEGIVGQMETDMKKRLGTNYQSN